MNTTVAFQSAISIVEEFQNVEPFILFNVADFLCAFTSAISLRYNRKSSIFGLPFAIATFLMCFGGSSITNFMHGVMMGYLRRSTGFISYLCGFLLIAYLPQSLIDSVFPTRVYQIFHFLVDAFLRVHCVTSWGADTAIRNHGSVISAVLSSVATGCGGGTLATILLDTNNQHSLMDKLADALISRKSEIEHLVTMSLFYQIAIGFIPLSFIHPIDPLAAKFLTFSLFMVLHCIERLTGLRLFVPLPFKTQKEDKTKKEYCVCYNKYK